MITYKNGQTKWIIDSYIWYLNKQRRKKKRDNLYRDNGLKKLVIIFFFLQRKPAFGIIFRRPKVYSSKIIFFFIQYYKMRCTNYNEKTKRVYFQRKFHELVQQCNKSDVKYESFVSKMLISWDTTGFSFILSQHEILSVVVVLFSQFIHSEIPWEWLSLLFTLLFLQRKNKKEEEEESKTGVWVICANLCCGFAFCITNWQTNQCLIKLNQRCLFPCVIHIFEHFF